MQKLCKEQELMKYSTKLSDAVHILAFIVLNPNGSLTSDSIAKPPFYSIALRKNSSILSNGITSILS